MTPTPPPTPTPSLAAPAATLRAGFIGLGNLGQPMAHRLVVAFPTVVFDARAEAARELVGAGGRAAGSCREVAEHADVIGVCVRDDAQVLAVVTGPDGILAGARPGAILSIHSTVLPGTIRDLARRAAERDVAVVDAPVTGGAAGARGGTLTLMVGGDAAAVERCRPVFAALGQIVPTGALGSGAATKLCNNLMTYLGFLAAFEATLLARHAGLSLTAMHAVTRASGVMTEPMRAFLKLHQASDEAQQSDGFQAMARGFADLADKDLAVTLAFAREQDVSLPGAALCQQLMARVYAVRDERRR
jgi:3-hydroxyisobutyrate dehydrogenase